MRIKRTRQFSKVLSSYSRCFGLNTKDLEVFLDHTFVRQALINQVNIYESICNMIGKGFRLVTSSCVINECKALGSLFFGALTVLRGFAVLKCRHEYDPSLGSDWCIRKRIRTSKRNSQRLGHHIKGEKCFLFALASNDNDLRTFARNVPGMPIIFIAQRSVNTEDIPEPTELLMNKITKKSLEISENEVPRLRAIDEKFGLKADTKIQPKKRKQKQHGVNPLSQKKKKRPDVPLNTTTDNKNFKKQKKRQRALRKTWAMCRVLTQLYGKLPDHRVAV